MVLNFLFCVFLNDEFDFILFGNVRVWIDGVMDWSVRGV